MGVEFVSSDVTILDLLRKTNAMTVTELASVTGVTATAVRQRLNRLLAQELIQRDSSGSGRGRPSHHYSLTEKGRRKTGANFADLAIALWQEIRSIEDTEVRRGLLQRIAKRLVEQYGDEIRGATITEKMESLRDLFGDRQVPVTVDNETGMPVLTMLACPYPELAEQDRSICSMEKMMISELMGENIRLEQCRLDGATCCTFSSG